MAISSAGTQLTPVSWPLTCLPCCDGKYLCYPEEAEHAVSDISKRKSSETIDGIFTEDVVIDAANNVWLRVFSPTQIERSNVEGVGSGAISERRTPIVLFYHGGGFLSGAPDEEHFVTFCSKIAKSCTAAVLSINYRLAPEFPYPAAYDDCYKAFEWLQLPEARSHLPAGADISQCFLLGDSAGGNIVHFMGCRAIENDISPVQLRGMIELQPFFGGEELTPAEINLKPQFLTLEKCHIAWRLFLPGHNLDHPNINVFGPNSPDIFGLPLPPILVVIGGDVLRDRNATYVQKLQEMGKEVTVLDYPGAPHAFYIVEDRSLWHKNDAAEETVYSYITDSSVMEKQRDVMEKVYSFIRFHTR